MFSKWDISLIKKDSGRSGLRIRIGGFSLWGLVILPIPPSLPMSNIKRVKSILESTHPYSSSYILHRWISGPLVPVGRCRIFGFRTSRLKFWVCRCPCFESWDSHFSGCVSWLPTGRVANLGLPAGRVFFLGFQVASN